VLYPATSATVAQPTKVVIVAVKIEIFSLPNTAIKYPYKKEVIGENI
jgi:hypothetical protein